MIDAHIHLIDIQDDVDVFLADQKAKAIQQLWCNSTRPSDWQKVCDLCATRRRIFPFFGVHPWYVDRLPKDWKDQLASFVKTHTCGVGEIGLDRVRFKDTFDIQKRIFNEQLMLAAH